MPYMRVFQNAWFKRFARKEKISRVDLLKAIRKIEKGLVDADLGGNIIKQRLARKGAGKSGGYRTIIVFRHRDKAFFIYGFAKKDRDNIDKAELVVFKQAAQELLSLSNSELQALIDQGTFSEIGVNDDKQ